MAKPSIVPTFDTGGTNMVAPAPSLIASGWAVDEIPTSANHNWLFRRIGDWLDWLNTGAVDFASLALTGNATIGGTLDVTGNTTLGGTLSVASNGTVTGTLTAAQFKHTTALQLSIPGSMVIDPNGTHTRQASGAAWTLGSSTNRLVYPICLPVGMRITSWEIYLNKSSSGTQTIAGRLYRMHDDGTEAALATGNTNSGNAPGDTLLVENAVNHTIAAQYQYYLVLNPAAAGGGDIARRGVVYYDRP